MTNKITTAISVLALIIAIAVGFVAINKSNKAIKVASSGNVGAVGTLPIENYVPAILYNDGYFSQRSMALGTTSPTDFQVDTIKRTFSVGSSTIDRNKIANASSSAPVVIGGGTGTGGMATTTIFLSKPCFVVTMGKNGDEIGYFSFATTTSNGTSLALSTSTAPCY